jgi:hypothetical protein
MPDIFGQTSKFADGMASPEEGIMTQLKPAAIPHVPVKELKFCRCRVPDELQFARDRHVA